MPRRTLLTTALVAAALAAAPGNTDATSSHHGVCRGYSHTMSQYIRFARAVLPDASAKDDRELRRIAHCMASWRRPLARRWRRRYETPPGWVIPAYIVACESSGQNLPPNGAGASGYYQIIPGTWASFGGLRYAREAYLASKRGQDIVARRIWVQAGPGQWDCA